MGAVYSTSAPLMTYPMPNRGPLAVPPDLLTADRTTDRTAGPDHCVAALLASVYPSPPPGCHRATAPRLSNGFNSPPRH